jgi:hypothetical protein
MPQLTEESVELRISKAHLQIAGTVITLLLSAVVWFLADAASELKTLSKTVTEFATYQKTNDLELRQVKKDQTDHNDWSKQINAQQDNRLKTLEERVLILEQKVK